MSFIPVFRALSPRQVSMMNSAPFALDRHHNLNTLASLKSRDMVTVHYLPNGVAVKPTKYGKQIMDAVKKLHQDDYFETRKVLGVVK